MIKKEGDWLSITDYANLRKISISSVRRHIKGDRVRYKNINGKYFIFIDGTNLEKHEESNFAVRLNNQKLKEDIKKMQNEIDDLKMLVDLYEKGHMLPTSEDNKFSHRRSPSIPG